jgi:hypothetical protein
MPSAAALTRLSTRLIPIVSCEDEAEVNQPPCSAVEGKPGPLPSGRVEGVGQKQAETQLVGFNLLARWSVLPPCRQG